VPRLDTGGGPGRFWRYRGLRPVLAIREVTPAVGIAAGRVLRRWYRAKGLTKQITVQRVERELPTPSWIILLVDRESAPRLRQRSGGSSGLRGPVVDVKRCGHSFPPTSLDRQDSSMIYEGPVLSRSIYGMTNL
jgi:hypothetical protein